MFGLDLNIRHITFAAGNFALGLYGYDFHSILGIGFIGFVNFIVSFVLSLILALRSRGVKFIELRGVVLAVKYSFVNNPTSFFYPPKN